MVVRIRYLKVFLDLAETKSFTLAAERNGLTQPAVSQQLHFLEGQFSSALIVRSRTAFRLTTEGEILHQYARKILQTYDKLNGQIGELGKITANTIRVATTPYIGLYCLPPYLQQFRAQHPQAIIQVEHCRTEQIGEDVLNCRADLGLVAQRVREPQLECIPFHKQPLVLICHPQHPFARQKKLRLEQLKGQTLMSFEQGYPNYAVLARMFRKHHGTQRQIIEFSHIEPIKRAVAIGGGVAIVPEVTVRREVADQTLAAVSITDGDFSHPLVAVRSRRKECSPLLKQFFACLKEAQRPTPVNQPRSVSRMTFPARPNPAPA